MKTDQHRGTNSQKAHRKSSFLEPKVQGSSLEFPPRQDKHRMEIIPNCEESRGLGGRGEPAAASGAGLMLVTPVGPRCRDRNA